MHFSVNRSINMAAVVINMAAAGGELGGGETERPGGDDCNNPAGR